MNSSRIQVSKTVLRRYTAQEDCVFAPQIGYISARRPALEEFAFLMKSDITGALRVYRSEDNGRSWAERPAGWDYPDKPLDAGSVIRMWAPTAPFADPSENIAFRLNIERAAPLKAIDWKNCPPKIAWHEWGRTMISYSYDEGGTWSEPEFMTARGAEFNPDHPFPGVWRGRNACIVTVPRYLKLRDGAVLILLMRHPLWPNGKVYASNGDAHYEVFAVRGNWDKQTRKLIFEPGKPIENNYDLSKHGIVEPCAAETDDGRLIMTARSQWPSCESRPIVKLICQSADGGRSWSRPESLRYEDGELVGSCASYTTIARSAKNGRFYYISNILPVPLYFEKTYSKEDAEALDLYENPQKISLSDPRNKLHIAELNPDTLRIKKETVTLIDSRQPGEPAYVRLSNWGQYEDRETGDFILYMTRNPGNEGWKPDDGISRDLFRYNITLPEN